VYVLTLISRAESLRELLPVLRDVAARPVPVVDGLCMRHWGVVGLEVRGRYLFSDKSKLEAFARAPSVDPAYAQVARYASELLPERILIEHVSSTEALQEPVFIIAAPRAGGTLLYNLLAQSTEMWTLDGEGEAVIEGIPRLHVADRGFDSHRLDDMDADAVTVHVLRAGFLAGLRDAQGRRFLELPEGERPARARLLEKSPANSLRIPFLATAFESARFVFLHRDARQNVSSILEGWRYDGSVKIPSLPGWHPGAWHFLLPKGWREMRERPLLDVAAFQWAAANRQAMEDLEAVPRDRWISVDYAELVAMPEYVVRRICEFARLAIDERRVTPGEHSPLSAVTANLSSPLKWRSNPEFNESVLRRYTPVRARLRSLEQHAPPPRPMPLVASVRFHCFLDEIATGAEPVDDDWQVNPSFQFQLGPTIPLPLLRRTRFRDRFLPGHPLAWVEDPATGVNYPFWVRPNQAYLFRRFVAGRQAPALDAALASRLLRATVLVKTASSLERRRREGESQFERARTLFAEQRYCEVPSLIHPAHVAALGRYYQNLIDSGEWELGDPQVRHRHGQHNEPVARYFQHQLISVVSRIAGEPVKPSYSYASAYRGGAVLGAHVDRKQCEFTLSLLVEDRDASAAEPWPLWFHLPQGKVAITQKVGDAILFRGCELPHWRERSSDEHTSTILLFHYVPQDFNETLD
jgi:hypothetical protein